MSREIKIYAEQKGSGFWTYLRRSAGALPGTPLHIVLEWVLEQLNFGNFKIERDSRDDVVSMTIGKAAAPTRPLSDDQAIENAKGRLLSVNGAGILAQCRESGIEPEHAHISKMVAQQSTEWGQRNVEIHYAFELIKVLARLNKKTFKLEAPPITGLAPASVVSYLRESTRCWLYGFHGASVALSRACLEAALKARLAAEQHADLEPLIDAATRSGLLDDCMAEVAHRVRRAGNRFLHGRTVTETDSRETLDATRGLVEHVFAS